MSPIIGLTDRVRSAFPTLGKIRKGGPAIKDKDGKTLKPGPDLDYFRFTSDRPEVQAKFLEVYGEKPTLINAYIPYAGVAEAFSTCKEEWSAGGLRHRCDGETVELWLGPEGKYQTTPKPCKGGCEEVGRLALILPELLSASFVGYVTLEMHGLHDLMSIQASLMAAWDARIGNALGLRGIPWIIRRVKQQVSTPGPNGKRIRRDKWLVKLEPAADWVQLQLQAAHNATMMLPAPSGQPVQMPEDGHAERHIDQDGGKIFDSSIREVEDEMPEPPDEPEATPAPTIAPAAAGPLAPAPPDWKAELRACKTKPELAAVQARIRALNANPETRLDPTTISELTEVYKLTFSQIEAGL